MLVAIEGIDGCGKSTLIEQLNLGKFSHFLYTKEPGSPFLDENIELRELVLSNKDFSAFERELLFYADANRHRRWIETLGDSVIISDRSKWSHEAYLTGCFNTDQMTETEFMIAKSVLEQSCAVPDALLYIRGDLDLMKERLKGKRRDAIEVQKPEFFQVVLNKYERLVAEKKEWPRFPLLILNARDPLSKNLKLCEKWIEGLTHGSSTKNGSRTAALSSVERKSLV